VNATRRTSTGGPVVFRNVDRPELQHVFYSGADGYAELVRKHEAGYRWLDERSGTFLRERPRRPAATRQPARRDYLSDALP
jgi:hypothetical protein